MPRPGKAEQPWLLPYENPLPKRFGAEFFREIPRTPGIYTMIGLAGAVLYVGKAKDLRARLASYKRAHPDQVSRKVMRMIHLVREIRWEECADEEAALLRENHLLRTLHPPFNVVNTRPEGYYFVGLGFDVSDIELHLTTNPNRDEGRLETFGAFKSRSSVRHGYAALLRLLWATQNQPERFELPTPLLRHTPPYSYRLTLSCDAREVRRWQGRLRRFLGGSSRELLGALSARLLEHSTIPPFLYRSLQDDLEAALEFYETGPLRNRRLRRRYQLTERRIAQESLDDLLVRYQMDRKKLR